jgi:hypothetical protein
LDREPQHIPPAGRIKHVSKTNAPAVRTVQLISPYGEGMAEEDFAAEVRHPPTTGERDGIEYLAERGRAARRPPVDAPTTTSPPEMRFTIWGDLSGVELGDYLMLVRCTRDGATGALLQVPELLIRRAIIADGKSRQSTD